METPVSSYPCHPWSWDSCGAAIFRITELLTGHCPCTILEACSLERAPEQSLQWLRNAVLLVRVQRCCGMCLNVCVCHMCVKEQRRSCALSCSDDKLDAIAGLFAELDTSCIFMTQIDPPPGPPAHLLHRTLPSLCSSLNKMATKASPCSVLHFSRGNTQNLAIKFATRKKNGVV